MGSMLNNRLYVLFFISLALSWSRSRVLEKRRFAIGEELPVDSFRTHAISFETDALNSEISALSVGKSKPLVKLQKSTLKEPKFFPPYVGEFVHPQVEHADTWTLLQTVGLLFPDSRQTEFLSLWRTDLAGYVTHNIQHIHGVGASLAKAVISIGSERQHMVETLSGFIEGNGPLVKKAINLFDQVLEKRGSSGGAALSTGGIVGVSQGDVKFSLRDAFGEQAWKRVSEASEDGDKLLKKLTIYDENNVQPSLIKGEISDQEYQRLANLVTSLQRAKKDIKTSIDVWKKLMEENPQTDDSIEALRSIKTRVHGLIENYKQDLISDTDSMEQ
ncbi:uncharacterized protein MELLADRAFT_108703 [Melampsora larici-populina 98AG31]|uniref:Secreted protein n=1 Tax=Melampsora larici-populina (strain 98AG31 / pathotype 3-4-7) TaxID=747676 RepID=F4RTZ0_MELLP|nr:uncharacterized protein MELLADRAFT_108703 [Melampsora larici-populina 98AG31]EGG04178.1 hypothetical protein MELLADRAFT_108703 [Melampsora larici-populina 98AG31]